MLSSKYRPDFPTLGKPIYVLRHSREYKIQIDFLGHLCLHMLRQICQLLYLNVNNDHALTNVIAFKFERCFCCSFMYLFHTSACHSIFSLFNYLSQIATYIFVIFTANKRGRDEQIRKTTVCGWRKKPCFAICGEWLGLKLFQNIIRMWIL